MQALFERPVVAIHPGAGNITKQWPAEHFSALIDLLIEREQVNVLMIGGPDEVEIVEDLLDTRAAPRARSPRWPARPRWRSCRACC